MQAQTETIVQKEAIVRIEIKMESETNIMIVVIRRINVYDVLIVELESIQPLPDSK